MKLEKILTSAAMITLFAAPIGIHVYTGLYIKSNLEEDAILCNHFNNLRFISNGGLPVVKNKDLDSDGKYESAIFYNNDQGQIFYIEITKKKDGELAFGKPKPYDL